MAKKDKSSNPVQAQHKKDKKALSSKLKKERLNRRDEKLAKRNPASIERQINALKSNLEPSQDEKELLKSLEKELALVKKVRERQQYSQGPVIVSEKTKARDEERRLQREKGVQLSETEKAIRSRIKRDPRRSMYYDEQFNRLGAPPPGMPWRERDDDGDETDPEVRNIPMPEGTPPPLPMFDRPPAFVRVPTQPATISYPSTEVQKSEDGVATKLEIKPSQTVEEALARANPAVIEAKPVLRDLRKEAISFVPTMVKRNMPSVQEKKEGKLDKNKEFEKLAMKPEEEEETKQEHELNIKRYATTIENVEDEDDLNGGELQRRSPESRVTLQPTLPTSEHKVTQQAEEDSDEEEEASELSMSQAQVSLFQASEASNTPSPSSPTRAKRSYEEPPPAQPLRKRRIFNAAPDV